MDASPVTYMTPADLLFRLDGSVDLETDWCDECEDLHGNGCACVNPDDHWQGSLLRKLDEKYDECYYEFITSLCIDGIQRPVCIAVTPEGKWIHGNGHHRTAVAIMEDLPIIPVIFSFTDNFMLMKSTSDPRLPNYEADTHVPDFYGGRKFSEERDGDHDESGWECPDCYESVSDCLCY